MTNFCLKLHRWLESSIYQILHSQSTEPLRTATSRHKFSSIPATRDKGSRDKATVSFDRRPNSPVGPPVGSCVEYRRIQLQREPWCGQFYNLVSSERVGFPERGSYAPGGMWAHEFRESFREAVCIQISLVDTQETRNAGTSIDRHLKAVRMPWLDYDKLLRLGLGTRFSFIYLFTTQ